jgi:amino acid permease
MYPPQSSSLTSPFLSHSLHSLAHSATTFHSVRSLVNDGYDESWGMSDIHYLPSGWSADTDTEVTWKSVIKAMPVIMFAFTCQVNVFSIYEELEAPSLNRMSKVSNGAMHLASFAYLFMGIFGYLDFGSTVQGNVLMNYCLKESKDPLMIAAFVCIVITIVMAYPLNIFPCRFTVEVILNRWRDRRNSKPQLPNSPDGTYQPLLVGSLPSPVSEGDETSSQMDNSTNSNNLEDPLLISAALEGQDDARQTSTFEHVTITFLISVASLIAALNVPNINTIFSLMGGTASAFVCFVLPAGFAIRLNLGEGSRLMTAGIWGLAFGGTAFGLLSTTITVMGFFNPEEETKFSC